MKNDQSNKGSSSSQRVGTSEQHAQAGRQSHKNDNKSSSGSKSGSSSSSSGTNR